MIGIKSVGSLYSIPHMHSINEMGDLQDLENAPNLNDNKLRFVDDLLGTGQSVFEFCVLLGTNPKTTPIMFFEELKQLKLKNEQIAKYNEELKSRSR